MSFITDAFYYFLAECPDGFVYLPETDGCYKVVLEALTWEDARSRCTALTSDSRLAVVQNSKQDSAIRDYIKSLEDDG